MRKYALSIVVPVYRGAATVGLLVEALAALQIAGGHEIILVNDGSPDNSAEVCRALAARTDLPLTFVNLSRNFGEHNAVMAGLRHARGDYVITMDDDLQNPPEVVKLFDHARAGRLGRGLHPLRREEARGMAQPRQPLRQQGGGRPARQAARALPSTFRCMSAFVVAAISRYEGPFPYVDGLIMQMTQHIDSIAVEHMARASGQSNYTVRRLVRLWLNLFINFSAMPLRLSVVAGFVIGLLGMVGCIMVIAEALLRAPPPGWASLMAATLLISGVQMVMLGIIGEYLGRLFLTANRKPQSLVREVVPPAAEDSFRIQAVPSAEDAPRFQAAQREAG